MYRRWASMQGEKFISAQNYFSRQVLREAKDAIQAKTTKVGAGGLKTARMWLTTPPPADVDMGPFIADCIDAFEAHLARYIGDEK